MDAAMTWIRGHSLHVAGGAAATPRSGWGGCVSDQNHPGCAIQGTGPFLGGAQPPLLGKEGNALDSNSLQPLQLRHAASKTAVIWINPAPDRSARRFAWSGEGT